MMVAHQHTMLMVRKGDVIVKTTYGTDTGELSTSDPSRAATHSFRLLTDSQLREIHQTALWVLANVGSRIYDEQAVEVLHSAGCSLSDGNLARIPASLVEDALANTPHRIVLHRRDGQPALWLEGNNTYFGTGSDLPNIIDLDTGERRLARLADVEEMARVSDALPNIDFVMCMALPSDVPAALADRYAYRAMVSNTVKPIVYTAWDLQGAQDIVAMAEAVAGGAEALAQAPTSLAYLEPSSPLKHSRPALQKLLFLAKKGLPLLYAPAALGGATGPVTPAGTLVQCTAEALTGLVLSQLVRKGTPFLWGSSGAAMDMRTMIHAYASPEEMLHNTAMAELAHHYYHLPVWGFSGCSDSKRPDIQAGFEGGIWVTVAALAANNLVHDCGYIESGLTASYEMLLATDDGIGLVRRFLRGISFSAEELALDAIQAVGPGGHYLDSDHTLRHFREIWEPRWFDRRIHANWLAKGGLSGEQSLRQAAKKVLAEHKVPPLPQPVLAKLDAVISTAAARAAG